MLFKKFLPAFLALPILCGAQPYSLNLKFDLPLAAGLGAMKWGSGDLLAQTRAKPLNLSGLNRQDIPFFDRWAIGFYSERISAASSALAYAELGIPLAVNAWATYHGEQPWYGGLVDAVLLEETVAFSSSLSAFAKSFPLHSTPLTYDPAVPLSVRSQPQNVSSFFSDHTTFAFSTAVYSAYTFQLRHPESPLVPWIWGGSLAMASGVGSMRVLAGKHFPSDVLTGAAVGALCGYLVPRLHSRRAVSRREKSRIPDWNLGVGFVGYSPAPELQVHF